jgi:hypothetical protein
MEENSEPASCPDLPLIPISRILKDMPHCPHFLQLRSYSKVARKNLMARWDRAFEEAIEEICSLMTKRLWVEAIEVWKTVVHWFFLLSIGFIFWYTIQCFHV